MAEIDTDWNINKPPIARLNWNYIRMDEETVDDGVLINASVKIVNNGPLLCNNLWDVPMRFPLRYTFHQLLQTRIMSRELYFSYISQNTIFFRFDQRNICWLGQKMHNKSAFMHDLHEKLVSKQFYVRLFEKQHDFSSRWCSRLYSLLWYYVENGRSSVPGDLFYQFDCLDGYGY